MLFLIILWCGSSHASYCPKSPLNCFYFLIFFLFASMIGSFFYIVFQITDLILASLNILFIPSTVFFISNVLFFISDSFVDPMPFFMLLSIIIIITQSLYLINCLSPLHLVLFLESYPVLSPVVCLFASSFCLSPFPPLCIRYICHSSYFSWGDLI